MKIAPWAMIPAILLVGGAASAAPLLQIQMQGINFEYTKLGGDPRLVDYPESAGGGGGNPASADPLTSVQYFQVDPSVPSSTLLGSATSDIWVDFRLNLDTPLTPGSTANINGGFFDLLTQPGTPGWGLGINVTSGQVQYSSTGFFFTLIGNAISGTLCPPVYCNPNNNIPFPIQGPFAISFSGTAGALKNDSFSAFGTGEIVGSVPEPSTYALLGLGLAAVAFARRRREG